jgi:hypothetical protein
VHSCISYGLTLNNKFPPKRLEPVGLSETLNAKIKFKTALAMSSEEKSENYRPDLSAERAPHRHMAAAFGQKVISGHKPQSRLNTNFDFEFS